MKSYGLVFYTNLNFIRNFRRKSSILSLDTSRPITRKIHIQASVIFKAKITTIFKKYFNHNSVQNRNSGVAHQSAPQTWMQTTFLWFTNWHKLYLSVLKNSNKSYRLKTFLHYRVHLWHRYMEECHGTIKFVRVSAELGSANTMCRFDWNFAWHSCKSRSLADHIDYGLLTSPNKNENRYWDMWR